MSYARVIVNPAAGAGRTRRVWPQIMGLFKGHGLRFEHDLTEAPGHAVSLARSAVEKGYELVVSVGGDGTINEVVNGLFEAGAKNGTTLGIVSTGTGSDYIRTIGIPRHYEAACRRLVGNKRMTVDLGIVEYRKKGQDMKRIFINFAGLGFDAEIVQRTTQQFKALGSMPSYLMGLLATFLFYRNQNVSISIDGEVIDRRVCTVMMNNGRYGGGGMLTAPEASLADGLFDVLVIDDICKPDLLWSLPRIYKGTHLTHPRVMLRKAREVAIRSEKPVYLQADGELLGELPSRFRVMPAALNVVV